MRLALEMNLGPRTTGHSEDVRLGLDRQEAKGLTFGCPRLTLASSNYPNGYPEMAKEEGDLPFLRNSVPGHTDWTFLGLGLEERIESRMDSGKNG